MKTYTYIPTGDVFQTKSIKAIVTYLRKNSRFFVNETDKEYMKGYSNRGSLLGQSIRFDKEVNFVSDLMKVGQLKEGNVLPKGGKAIKGSKAGIGGRVSIDKKVERITKMRELDKRFDERDAEMTKSGKIPIKKEIDYRLLAMQRREKRRNEGLIPKNFSEERERKFPTQKKKIGSTDSVLTLSKIKDFVETLGEINRDRPNRRSKIQKFIQENSPNVNAENIPNNSTIWVFSGAPQYYIGRAKLKYKSSSKSPNFITLYLTDDTKYEEWRKADSYANSMKDFDQISIPAMRFGEGKYYKSIKKDKKVPLG